MIRKLLFCACFFALISIVACSSNDKSTTNTSLPRDVTTEQSKLLARALSNNAVDKNASFKVLSGQFGASGFGAIGKVNWIESVVELEVALLEPNTIDIASVTSNEGVFESFASLKSGMSNAGLAERSWVFRDFDPGKYGIDSLSQFIVKLSALTPDNPILLKQNGAQYLGDEEVENVKTSKFQNTPAVTYFLTSKGELKKVTARIKGFENEVSIVFNDRKTTTIEVPSADDSYPLEKVSSFYSEMRPPF